MPRSRSPTASSRSISSVARGPPRSASCLSHREHPRQAAAAGRTHVARLADRLDLLRHRTSTSSPSASSPIPPPGSRRGSSGPRAGRRSIWAALCIHHVDDPDGPHVVALSVGAKGALDIGIGALKIYATATVVWRTLAQRGGRQRACCSAPRPASASVSSASSTSARHRDGAATGSGRRALSGRASRSASRRRGGCRTSRSASRHAGYAEVCAEMEVASTPLDRGRRAAAGDTRADPHRRDAAGRGRRWSRRRSSTSSSCAHGSPPVIADATFAALEPVAVDSRIALDFKPSLDAPVTVVPDTPAGRRRPGVGGDSVRYELVEIGIRRRKRFGPDAGVWVDLLHAGVDAHRVHRGSDRAFHVRGALRVGRRRDPRRAHGHAAAARERRHRVSRSARTVPRATTWRRRRSRDGRAARAAPAAPLSRNGFRRVGVRRARAGVAAVHRQRAARSPGRAACRRWSRRRCHAPAGSFPVFVHVAPRPPGPIAVASFDERVALCEIFAAVGPDAVQERARRRGLRRSGARRVAEVPGECRVAMRGSLRTRPPA